MSAPSPRLRPQLRPSLSSRLSIAISTRSADEERGAHRNPHQQQEHFEEIDEIRRYEDFTTIDWVQDAARAQLRRRRQKDGGFFVRGSAEGWRWKLRQSYEAGQAWIVISLIGRVVLLLLLFYCVVGRRGKWKWKCVCIGLNASFLNIITEWLSDIRMGRCTTAFYLNENFCCWGSDEAEADSDLMCRMPRMAALEYDMALQPHPLYSLLRSYPTSSSTTSTSAPPLTPLTPPAQVLFAYTSAILVKSFAPYAAGSGISEIKCILAGFVMKGFLGGWTLLIKSIGLPLAIASGLSVGKEGPSVHYAVCTGNVISRFFAKYRRNAAKMREILSACAAAGVAVAFGSPIGGVLFSLEEMSSNFPLKTMWRSYFCALVATAVLAAMNPFRTGQLVMFQVSYDRDWHFFEVVFFVIIGVFGGLYGEFVIKWNLRAQSFRKRYLKEYAIAEVTFLAGVTAVICYANMFLRIDMTESMEILFLVELFLWF
ncbi:Clc chloride channel [Morchella conica CCBAS932]|uniref:Clc chloride channel n=1 Tax=Morchella conica CCBAS932 TaxID=1392247 RepID=A0A3N4KAY5_9PEZI|nr:Clc chloride channel [Morchella conica CCBAS932]